MTYKVGVLITRNDCILLTMKTNILGTQYDFPMWDYKTGEIPIETINSKVKEMGIKHDNKAYMGKTNINKANIYLYLIKKWEGQIKEKKYVWVHKAVLMMNKNSLPFDREMLNEIF